MTLEEKYDALGGQVPWPALAAGAAPWLSRLLLGDLPGPQARVKAWAAAGCPTGPWTIASIGDARLEKVCTVVAASLPPPVAQFAASRAIVVTLNPLHDGWGVKAPYLPGLLEHALMVVNVGNYLLADEAEAASTVAHEIAHVWDKPDGLAIDTPAERVAIFEAMRADLGGELQPVLAQHVARSERRARALAREWGFVGNGSEPWECVRSLYTRIQKDSIA